MRLQSPTMDLIFIIRPNGIVTFYQIHKEERGCTSAVTVSSLAGAPEADLPPLWTILKHDTDASTDSGYFESTKEDMQNTHTIGELGSAAEFKTPPAIGEIRIDAAGRDTTQQQLLAAKARLDSAIKTRAGIFWKDPYGMINCWYDRLFQKPVPWQSQQVYAKGSEQSASGHRLSDSPPEAFHAQIDFFHDATSKRWAEAQFRNRSTEGVAARLWPNYYAPQTRDLETKPRETQMDPLLDVARTAPRKLGPLPNIYDVQSPGHKALCQRIEQHTRGQTNYDQRHPSSQGHSHAREHWHGQSQRPTPHIASGGRSGLRSGTGVAHQFKWTQQTGYATTAYRSVFR